MFKGKRQTKKKKGLGRTPGRFSLLKFTIQRFAFIISVYKPFIELGGNASHREGDTLVALQKLPSCAPFQLNWISYLTVRWPMFSRNLGFSILEAHYCQTAPQGPLLNFSLRTQVGGQSNKDLLSPPLLTDFKAHHVITDLWHRVWSAVE